LAKEGELGGPQSVAPLGASALHLFLLATFGLSGWHAASEPLGEGFDISMIRRNPGQTSKLDPALLADPEALTMKRILVDEVADQ